MSMISNNIDFDAFLFFVQETIKIACYLPNMNKLLDL